MQRMLDAQTMVDFRTFVRRAFFTLNPGTPLAWNWHLDYMCYLLTRTLPVKGFADPKTGEMLTPCLNPTPHDRLRRLIINVPPRSLKSITVSSAFPAFVHAVRPDVKIIDASYSAALSKKLHADTVRIIESDWYQRLFPWVRVEASRADEYVTDVGGNRKASSVGGTLTGYGGDIIIADDILNAAELKSEAERNNANQWFDTAFMSRLDDKVNGAAIVVMQRLHEEDLTGHLIQKNEELAERDKWTLAVMPAVFEETVEFEYYGQKKTIQADELLHEERLPTNVLAAIKAELGSMAYACQYLQSPAPADGNIINVEWFKRYKERPERSEVKFTLQSWDTAMKTGQKNDFSACTTWEVTKNGYYLIDVTFKKQEYPELKRQIATMHAAYRPNVVLIEDKVSGQSLLQDLKQETTIPLLGITPTMKKEDRAQAITPIIEAGKVYIPERAPWMDDFEKQITFFPNGKHDDIVDSVTQALDYLRRRMNMEPRVYLI